MLHIQDAPQGWEPTLFALRGRVLLKGVNQPGLLAATMTKWLAAGRAASDLVCYHRDFNWDTIPRGTSWAGAVAWCQAQFARSIDKSYLQSYAWAIKLVGEANEYTATTTWQEPDASAWALLNMQAASYVWNTFYRGRTVRSADGGEGLIPADCRLALCAGPVSNDIAPDVMRLAIADDQVVDYHAYRRYEKGQLSQYDQHDDSMRWDRMEQEAGLKPRWVFGEGGPYSDVTKAGWRSPSCLGADLGLLEQAAASHQAQIQGSAAWAEGRLVAPNSNVAYFTCSSDQTWKTFRHDAASLAAVSRGLLSAYQPAPQEDPIMTVIVDPTQKARALAITAELRRMIAGPLYQARVLQDLALRDSAGNPAADPVLAPAGSPAGVVKAGTMVSVYEEGISYTFNGQLYANRAVVRPDGANVWGVAAALQKI